MVEFVQEGPAASTRGLSATGQDELAIRVDDPALLLHAEALLRSVVLHVARGGRPIRDGETFGRGFWHVRFTAGGDGRLWAWEYDPETIEFRPGAEFALTAWSSQQATCEEHESEFVPPRPDQLVVVSPGVLEGDPTQGIRYPSPEHMSGWWISTQRYDGDVSTMTRVHAHHVAAARPDLVPYLALDFGWRWNFENDPRVVRFDPAVLEDG